ncbi:5-oxoprolinase subunit C family protein [Cytobacillus dafuensis]|uniref:Biotin-dependent carboxyltransferase family protein n=1 Tax=Cytobacillus dafuensis TaxID=1742359 RepID=A0A5B8Z058_CYTDA|nr:biotin-dependent carboxyltransferase family protein [Cytobacillus dafuensis]QED46332.1 biotin-dependent carboxyltransferase family protein [Cytobacillus dafuensis]
MIPLFKVKKPGLYGSIQDKGRFGFQRYGVPVSGPMDSYAYKYGHYMLHNSSDCPALELFLGGIELEVLADHRIVITGADLGAKVDERDAPLWKSFLIYEGQMLSFSGPRAGSIAYVIPEGGFYAEERLGSAAAYPKGHLGSVLKKDTVLYAQKEKTDGFERGLVKSEIPSYNSEVRVKLWKSPHWELFTKESLEVFFQSNYTLKGGDRMGYLLDGPVLKFIKSGDILSEATQFGTIQVPNSGRPIILMADAQTIGGYATIGKVVEEDLWKVAQLKTGGKIEFILKN